MTALVEGTLQLPACEPHSSLLGGDYAETSMHSLSAVYAVRGWRQERHRSKRTALPPDANDVYQSVDRHKTERSYCINAVLSQARAFHALVHSAV